MVVQKSVRRSGIFDSPESKRRGVPESCLHWSQTLPKCPEVRKPRFWTFLQDSNSRILYQMGRKEIPAAPIRSQKRDSRSSVSRNRTQGQRIQLILSAQIGRNFRIFSQMMRAGIPAFLSDHKARNSCSSYQFKRTGMSASPIRSQGQEILLLSEQNGRNSCLLSDHKDRNSCFYQNKMAGIPVSYQITRTGDPASIRTKWQEFLTPIRSQRQEFLLLSEQNGRNSCFLSDHKDRRSCFYQTKMAGIPDSYQITRTGCWRMLTLWLKYMFEDHLCEYSLFHSKWVSSCRD
jgi:hypothetical protein